MNDDKRLGVISVRHGTNPGTRAGSIGGVDSEFDDDGQPIVVLSIGPKGGPSVRRDLHVDETFELGPELWQVTEIINPDTKYWAAKLTQLR